MGVLDKLTDIVGKFGPKKGSGGFSSGGIGNGHGMVPFDDNMIVSKPAIIAHSGQIFFNFLAMACYGSVASFQAKHKVGPSGLSGFAIFVSVAGILLSAFMLLIPVAYERYDKFVQLARTLKEVRVSFILTGTGATFSLLIAFISTISVWTQPGCKDASKDPSAEEQGDAFKDGLPGWCNTKKAASIFFWITFLFWGASVGLLIWDWRSGRLNPHAHRDTPFTRPQASEEDDEEGGFTHIQRPDAEDAPSSALAPPAAHNPFNDPSSNSSPSSYNNSHTYSGYTGTASAIPPATAASYANVPQGRPSMDAYGAFSDPAPSGFGTSYGGGYAQPQSHPHYASSGSPAPQRPLSAAPPPQLSVGGGGAPLLGEPDLGPRLSRTMQYADPYAAVRASVGGATSPTGGAPPSYETYGGYR